MMGFLISRYFGLRSFGQILGTCFVGFAIGVGVGPVVMGVSYDATHSYYLALVANIVAIVVATGLIATLGSYVYAKGSEASAATLPEAAAHA
jgi:cyanate permease